MNFLPRLTLGTAFFAALSLAVAPVQARPAVPITHPMPSQQLHWDSKKFMHVSELRPGMRGYALTVFRGTKIEKFGIEILGVVAKFNEGKDYILFRALDGPSVTRGLGIAHGMSGSPIYIHGRLVGAISMGIPGTQFARDPIALATPIEDMFDAWSPDLPQKPSDLSAAPPNAASNEQNTDKSETRNFQPLGIPLMVSGMDARGLAHLSDRLAPFHFDVMAGGGMGDGLETNPLAQGATLIPGSAVGVSLVQGDMDLTATGTVTYRDGNRLLLFGHPFTSLGPIDAALTTAYVVSIFPSYQDSIKIGSPIKTVGRIFQDRPFSVGGVIGPMPQMVPMTVSVDDQSIKRRKVFHLRIINHPLLTGEFVSQLADTAIDEVHGQPGDSMATVTFDVDAEEIGHIKRTNVYYDPLSIDQTAIGDLDSLMHLLSSNPFYPLAVKSVKMNVTIQNRHDTAEIDHLYLTQSKFAPGDTITVGVVLKPYKQPLYTQMISVKIPASTPDGVLPLSIRSGGSDGGGTTSLFGGLLQIRTADPVGSAFTVGQLVKQFTEKAQNNQLVAHLTLPNSVVSLKGEKLTGLPPTLASAMQSLRTTGLKTERDEVKTTQTVPYIVSGSQTLNITVQRKALTDTSLSAVSADSPASPSSDPTAPPAPSGPTPLSSGGDNSSEEDTALLMASLSPVTQAPTVLLAASKESSDHASPGPASSDSPPQSGDTGTSEDAASDDNSAPAVKTVGRLPSIWRQGTATDFSDGILKNVAVTSLGEVRLASSLQKFVDTSENYIWAMLPDGKGNIYLGTGDGGLIDKMDSTGKITPFYKTGDLEVTSLALGDDNGTLYAGTAPHGLVFEVNAKGTGRQIFKAQEKYVTALAVSSDTIYAATGGGTGRVYHLSRQALGGPTVSGSTDSRILFTSPEAHILSLATDKDGTVYAGSAPDGIVYKITPDSKSSVLYDAAEPNITALATDSKGNVYAGTSTTGTVYRIAPDGTAKRLLTRSSVGVTGLQTDSTDAVYAASGNAVYRISPDDSVQSFIAPADEQFLSLTLDPSHNAVYTGTGIVGSVYKIDADSRSALQGSFQSTIHDAGGRAQWGTVDWTADVPSGAQITLQTRSGDVPRPDASWSAWSAPYTQASGQSVASPPARYLQYQAVFTSSTANTEAPRLRDVDIFYLPRNRPPTVGITKPGAGDALSKTTTFQWTASDPDKDTLSYDVSYSSDGGKTWTPITTRARLTTQTKTKVVSTTSAVSQGNLDQLTDVPPAVRAQILAQVAANTTLPAPAKPAQNLKETSYHWDTTQVPDGVYQVEVVASDRPSNPVGALTAKVVSAPFLIANAAPTMTLDSPTVGDDHHVTLHGTAQAGPAFVKAVQAKVDGGDPVAASADDGLFDSPSEAFTLSFPNLASGSHKIEVLVLDRAGNSTTQTVMVTVP